MANNRNRKLISLPVICILLVLTACAREVTNNTHETLLPRTDPPQIKDTIQPTPTATTSIDSEKAPTVILESTPLQQQTLPADTGEDDFTEVNNKVREKDGATIIYIPEGEFLMGCDPDQNAGFDCVFDELPLHAVVLSAYFIDQHEVTNGQYQQCVEADSCQEPVYKNSLTRASYYGEPAFDDYPVIAVTWFEANAYCQWVGGRLPSEAEWEKAARGTQPTAFPWGNQIPDCSLANSYDNASGSFCVGDTAKVGSYPEGASVYGVMDMAGNVWEWVNDWYSAEYYRFSPLVDPPSIDSGSDKVIRGGGFDYSWSKLRVAYKSNHHPETRHLSYGFRCVNPIEDKVQ